ncbi:MAG: excinuclease ABC subunit UvrC [Mycoplasmataceae bacterium]|jgi:excinuclease ABC subunit C|nr:excinuclease ABC subunit UvrC [Mycoplasmataceae bacterium]
MIGQQLEFKLERIPKKPGVYLWKNKYGQVIYVGKAKNLFNRTHQYFDRPKDGKTSLLVEHIVDVDFIVVRNENESLLLEANLIRKYHPKYNILLKDGSSYPYILLTNELHPRLLYTRDYKKVKGKYYGPFATTKSNRYDTYNLLLKLFPFRKCNYIPRNKCLYYDVGQCLGPCINNIKSQQYDGYIKQIDSFFKGDPKKIVNGLRTLEQKAAQNLNYEEAKRNLDLIEQIKNVSKEMSLSQTVNLRGSQNEDIVGYHVQDNLMAIVVFSYVNGKLLTKHQQITEIFNDYEEVLNDYLIQYYYKSYNLPKKCYVNLSNVVIKQLTKLNGFKFIKPISGKHKSILQNAALNAKNYMQTNYLIYKQHKAKTDEAFNELRKILSLDNLSLINVFDISNLFGDDKVAGMVALEDGVFNKNLYRKFIINDLDANSDYAAIYEVIKRQYARTIKEGRAAFPNLIIVDGGLIQINAATKALHELNLDRIIPVIGLSKDNHHKTNCLVFQNKKQITLDKHSSVYLFLLNIQEEVHRYAINFFREKYKNSTFKTMLNEIPGLGVASINKLLSHYDNIANIKKASISELSQYVKENIARLIKEKLN